MAAPVPPFCVCLDLFKQQYISCMMVGSGENLDFSREYPEKLFGPLFYSWWNCPLINNDFLTTKHVRAAKTRFFYGIIYNLIHVIPTCKGIV